MAPRDVPDHAIKVIQHDEIYLKVESEWAERIQKEGLEYLKGKLYPNGGTYKGKNFLMKTVNLGYMKDNKRHGPGTFIWIDDSFYNG